MIIQKYHDPSDFLSLLETMFSNPFKNELMIGLTATILKDPFQYQTHPFLSTITKDEIIDLVAFMTPPWPIILYAESRPDDQSYIKLIDELHKKNISVSGVNAMTRLSSRFAELWMNHSTDRIYQKMRMSLYILQKTQPIQYSKGEIVIATSDHTSLLSQWAIRFHEEMKLQYENQAFIKKHVTDIINSKNAFLLIDEEPVSMVFLERPHQNGVMIGYVYTPEEWRNKRYAQSIVHEACNIAFKRGAKYCALFADRQNPVSNHIYRKIGFHEACEYTLYDFTK